jgi:NDP-sugar pyrophosphorylase family protein
MTQLVIPMAGLGQRFVDAGYALPKPLIPVGGVPMVLRVINNLPSAERVVFICHPEHITKYPMWDTLERSSPNCKIIVAPGLTEGQACSTALAIPYLDLEAPVLVAACDSTQVYDRLKWHRIANDTTIDAAVWCFSQDTRVLNKPEAWGWIRQDEGTIKEVSVKIPISSNPLTDAAVTGTFWFRTAKIMQNGIEWLVQENRRVKNEFYLDSVPNVLTARNYKVTTFQVDKYIGWGTPDDYEDYICWERHFANRWAA